MNLYFTDAFNVPEKTLAAYGAFNVSLVVDLPLFVDPFLLFHSKKPTYQKLHNHIIDYLVYLRDHASGGNVTKDQLRHLYCFSEVTQTWLGFSQTSNRGRGLGGKFAEALASNLHNLFKDFGDEKVTQGSHMEKLCLIREGVGKDMISDFTTNLIKKFLCEYTEMFAKKYLRDDQCDSFAISRVDFHLATGVWAPATFRLPKFNGDYVILTPRDILTKDDNWISKEDLYHDYNSIPAAMGNAELRGRIDNYFRSVLPRRASEKEETEAKRKTILRFPEIIDYYILYKEQHGDSAESVSAARVKASEGLYIRQFGDLVSDLHLKSDFYKDPPTSRQAALEKAMFLKDVIENKGGHKIFYHDGCPLKRETDLQILYRLVWHKSSFEISREVNDGRGPVDYKVSRGGSDKTLVEMKLASNSKLERNLQKQVEIYKKASDAHHAIKIIIFFTRSEEVRTQSIIKRLKLDQSEDIVLIDARADNKPSGSKA